MTEVAEYLMTHYYANYKSVPTPSMECLMKSLVLHKDHMVIIKDDNIKGVAVYLTLSDETYEMLGGIDMDSVDFDTAIKLFKEQGKNVHFIILAANCLKTIQEGMREVIEREKPKTMSWFNPDNTRLHIRRF